MRARVILGEVWRDVVSGTTRAGLLAVVFVVLVGSVALVDVRSVAGVVQGGVGFRAAGATVQMLQAPGLVDGWRCDALSDLGSVSYAGAVRQAEPVRILNLPSARVTVIEATPGVVGMLSVMGRAWTDEAIPDGVWLSEDLATMLGAAPGTVLETSTGEAVVQGVYAWPDDGRSRDLGYAILTPVPAAGVFDQCWLEVWPVDAEAASLAYTSLTRPPEGGQVTTGQLNTRLGASYDAAGLLRGRLTAQAPLAGLVIGLGLGYVAVRTRRLEIASALHARVPRAGLLLQYVLEVAAWAGAGMVILAAGLLWGARWDNPDRSWATWLIGLRIVVAGGAATIFGALAALATTREKHLFRYAKER